MRWQSVRYRGGWQWARGAFAAWVGLVISNPATAVAAAYMADDEFVVATFSPVFVEATHDGIFVKATSSPIFVRA